MSAVILRFDDRGRSRITPPVLPAYKHPNGIHALVWCQFCQRCYWHSYGAGHRVAHCGSRGGALHDVRLCPVQRCSVRLDEARDQVRRCG
jgi:hypothetical protein